MIIIIVYDTMWHNTEKMAGAITQGIISRDVEVKFMKLRENHRSGVVTEILEALVVL